MSERETVAARRMREREERAHPPAAAGPPREGTPRGDEPPASPGGPAAPLMPPQSTTMRPSQVNFPVVVPPPPVSAVKRRNRRLKVLTVILLIVLAWAAKEMYDRKVAEQAGAKGGTPGDSLAAPAAAVARATGTTTLGAAGADSAATPARADLAARAAGFQRAAEAFGVLQAGGTTSCPTLQAAYRTTDSTFVALSRTTIALRGQLDSAWLERYDGLAQRMGSIERDFDASGCRQGP